MFVIPLVSNKSWSTKPDEFSRRKKQLNSFYENVQKVIILLTDKIDCYL